MGAEPGGLFAGKRDVCGAGREDYYSRSTLSKFDVFISNDWSDTNVGLFVLKGTSLYIELTVCHLGLLRFLHKSVRPLGLFISLNQGWLT